MVTVDSSPATKASGLAPLRLFLGVGLALGLGLVAIFGLGLPPKLRAQALRTTAVGQASGPRTVHVVPVRAAPLQKEVTLPATVVAIETAKIYARTSGFVREYKVDIGDRVKKEQVLAILDTPEIEADAQSARARQKEFEQNQKLSQTTADRYRRLSDVGVTSADQADQLEAQANSVTASLDTSRGELARINTLLGFRYVKAPFDGVVTKRNIERGTLVTAGSGTGVTSLFEIARTDALKAVVDVPQALAGLIRAGDTATVRVDGTLVPGKITRTAGAIDPLTRTLRVEVGLPGDGPLLPGTFVRIALSVESGGRSVIVPANTLAPRAEGLFVFVVNSENVVEARVVDLGRELGVDAEVENGLSVGENVIQNPPDGLASGDTIRIAGPEPQGGGNAAK
jgi:RND family efflux transporter MFP subunit